MSASQRRKGHDAERELVHLLQPTWPDAKRGLGQARPGCELDDIEGVPGFRIEAKAGKRPQPFAALDQALAVERAHPSGRVPVAACKPDRRGWHVTMRLDDWVALAVRAERMCRRECECDGECQTFHDDSEEGDSTCRRPVDSGARLRCADCRAGLATVVAREVKS